MKQGELNSEGAYALCWINVFSVWRNRGLNKLFNMEAMSVLIYLSFWSMIALQYCVSFCSAVLAVWSHSVVSDSAALWTVACQAPLSMGILQARILEWVVMPSFRGSSQPRNQTRVSCIAGRFFTSWAIREAQPCEIYISSPTWTSLSCISHLDLSLVSLSPSSFTTEHQAEPLFYTATPHQLSISYLVVYICQP